MKAVQRERERERDASACMRRPLAFALPPVSSRTYLSFKGIDPGGFNMDFIGSSCTALPPASASVASRYNT